MPFVGGSATATTASSSTLFGYIFGGDSGMTGVKQYYANNYSASFNIPSNLKYVTVTGGKLLYGAFSGCTCLTNITISGANTSIDSYAFKGCTSLTNITISGANTSIGSYAFSTCSKLPIPFVVPATVTSIGDHAFYEPSTGTKLQMESTVPATLSSSDWIDDLSMIYVPASALDDYRSAEYWQSHAAQIIPIGCKQDYDVTVEAQTTLSSVHVAVGENNLNYVESLKVSGTINGYDLMVMRNKMPNLHYLDLSDARIVSDPYEYYTGYSSVADTWTRYAFYTKLLTLKVPNTIKTVDAYAMNDLTYLESITIPASVETIKNYGLSGNSTLKAIEFEEGSNLTSIGNYAFSGRSGISSLSIPDNVTSIGTYAFEGCSGLTSVNLPNSVKAIGTYAFKGCTGLTSITIPNSVTSLGAYAFSGCSGLVSITLPFVGTSADATTASQSTLFGYMFGGTSGTTKVTQYYASSGYSYCYIPSKLKSVTINGGNLLYGAFSGCTGLTSITLGEDVSSIDERAFYNCTSLASVNIPEKIKSIGEYAFWNCYSLPSISIPESVTTLGQHVFYGCTKLATCTIPDNSPIDMIPYCAFYNCAALTGINLTENVAIIDESAFSGCSSLASVEIPAATTEMRSHAFEGCTSMKSCVIPANSTIAEIPYAAFSGCSSLEKMDLPVSVTAIDEYAFQNCTALSEVKIPSAINNIGNYAFSGCPNLFDVYTYTIEPQEIDQQTFTTFSGATLHVPSVSWYNYFYDTQWSQFLKLVNFDEPYDYVFVEKDYTLQTDALGTIDGKPEFDVWAGGGLIISGDTEQDSRKCMFKYDGSKWSSIIPRKDNFKPDNLYINIEVNKDFWYAFTFPFDIDTTKIIKAGDYVFRRYDGSMRADNGTGGWQDIEGTTLKANTGYIFRTNTAGTLSIPVAAPDMSPRDFKYDLAENPSGLGSAHAGWNFIGNSLTSYYSMNDIEYTAPIVVWNGTSYEAFRPGDDEHVFHPFEAFFVQRGSTVPDCPPHLETDKSMTYLGSQNTASLAKSRKARAAKLNPARKLINLTLSDGTNTDKCRIVFNEKQSMDYEAECDAAKFLSSESVPQLYSMDSNGTKYAINERPQEDGMVELGFIATKDGEYTLSASRADVHIRIYDYDEDITHDFADGDYTFTSAAGTFNQRFAISVVNGEETDINTIATNGNVENAGENAVVYDLSGRAVKKPAKGVYIVNGQKKFVK